MLVVFGVLERLGQDTVHVRAVGVFIAFLVAEVINRVRRGGRFVNRVLNDVQTVRQTVVLADRHAACGYTDQLFQFRDVERMVRFQEQVVPTDGYDYFLVLVDDMRREHQRILQASRINHLEHYVIHMTMKFIGVMHLNEFYSVSTGNMVR